MIDAMCSECVYFGSSLFSRRPGWRCGQDVKNQREHDPTDQACDKFKRKGDSTELEDKEDLLAMAAADKEQGDLVPWNDLVGKNSKGEDR